MKRTIGRRMRPEAVMCLGFLALILLGGLALALPAASADGRSVGLGNAVFTAASAVCVTGLIVVDTGSAFSLFGQIVLLVLIQTGGLGFMVFATMLMAAFGRRVTLRGRLLLRESLNAPGVSGLMRLAGWYGSIALTVELLGALALAVRFVPAFGWSKGLYFGLWHAVSAFCNAGFDLFGGYASLSGFAEDPMVLLTVAALILLGGTGFAVIGEVVEKRFRWSCLSLHARLVLTTSAALTAGGTALIALLEWRNPKTLGGLDSSASRLMNAFFQAVTMRTAGFNSVDLAAMTDAAKLVCALLMLIGASPASTGGGMKTTTVAVMALGVWAVIRGRRDAVAFRRRIPQDTIRRASAILLTTLLFALLGTLLLTICQQGRTPFIDLVVEMASALATVGVSSAGTPQMTLAGKAALIPMMYLGRVGPLTLAAALANRRDDRPGRLRRPEEQVTIG